MNTEDDDTIILYFLQGNEDAFNEIVKRYSHAMINFFFRLCWQRELAEELAQDVFIRIYINIDKYTAQGTFKAYIYKIARNLWIDFLRSRRGKKELLKKETCDEVILNNLKTKYSSPEEMFFYQEKLEILKKAIDSLPSDQKMAFVLYQNDMTYSEIAEVLALPEGTVKSRLYTVFNKIKKTLFED